MVSLLKCLRSSGMRHGRVLSMPITRFFAIATMIASEEKPTPPAPLVRGGQVLVTSEGVEVLFNCLPLNRYWSLNRRMRVIPFQREILELELENISHARIEQHRRQRARLTQQLLARLFHVVRINVRIAKGVHEITWLESAYLRHHQREQCVGGDVERYAEENVRAALVELAG